MTHRWPGGSLHAVDGSEHALIMLDRYSGLRECAPVATKSAEEAEHVLRRFAGARTVRLLWTDGSSELSAAARAPRWAHGTSQPGMPQTNAVAERNNGLVIDGARMLLE